MQLQRDIPKTWGDTGVKSKRISKTCIHLGNSNWKYAIISVVKLNYIDFKFKKFYRFSHWNKTFNSSRGCNNSKDTYNTAWPKWGEKLEKTIYTHVGRFWHTKFNTWCIMQKSNYECYSNNKINVLFGIHFEII